MRVCCHAGPVWFWLGVAMVAAGLLVAVAGSAVAQGECRSLFALLLITASILRKTGVEEQFMTRQFPAAYAEYRRQVPALIPYPFRSR